MIVMKFGETPVAIVSALRAWRIRLLAGFIVALLVMQSPIATSQVLPFHEYTIEQGLVSNGVTALLQDSKGFLWIGTAEGLSVFEGVSFRNVTVADGLPMNGISSLSESRCNNGTILIGTWGGGVAIWKNGSLSTLTPDTIPPAMNVSFAGEDAKGTSWCATQSGIYNNAGGNFRRIAGLNRGGVMLFSRDSLVWIADETVVRVCTPGSGAEIAQIPLPGRADPDCIHEDRTGTIWLARSDSTLIRIDERKVAAMGRLPFATTYTIADDVSRHLWLASAHGLFKLPIEDFSSASVTGYGTTNGLPSRDVRACLVDLEENLWVGAGSLLRLSDWNIHSFPLRNVPQSYNNTKAVVDERAHIWALSEEGVLEVWKDRHGLWRSFTHRIPFAPNPKSTPTIVLDNRQRLWIDGGHRIEVYEISMVADDRSILKKIKSLNPGKEIPDDPRFFFVVDSTGGLWISSLATGVYRVHLSDTEPGTGKFAVAEGLPEKDIRAMLADRRGGIWFGGASGGMATMSVLSASIEAKYTSRQGMPDDYVRGILQDKQQRIWIATRRNGIGVLDDGRFKHISVRDGLIGSAIWALAADDVNNFIWAGSQFGVQCIDAVSLKPLRPKKALLREPVTSLGTYRGQFLWYVTSGALTVYEYGKPPAPTPPPRVYVAHLTVSGRSEEIREPMIFSHDRDVCIFDYIGIGYRDIDAMQFQYRLRGVEEEWQPKTSQRTVTYASLAPGSYTFEVQAINGEGMVTPAPASVSFSIAPPFWATWWFIGVSAILLVGTAALVFQSRVSRLLEIEHLRSRIARDLHDEIGSNLSSIAIASDAVRSRATPGGHEDEKLARISAIALSTVKEMRDLVWLINPGNDSLDDLFLRMKDTAASILDGCECRLSFPEEVNPRRVNLEWKRNVYLIYKESLTNVQKHSLANEVAITASVRNNTLTLQIADNGGGFDANARLRGNGLRNMKARADSIGARLKIHSGEKGGTSVVLETRIT